MITLRLSLASAFCTLIACSAPVVPPREFDSPEQALGALERAVASKSREEARTLLGSEGDFLFDSGDPTLDDNRARQFTALFSQGHALQSKGEGVFVVVLGEKRWPFAVPIVRREGRWVFDADAGKEEILARRIGANEFLALDVARTVYLAQRTYASRDWDGDGVYRYAERLVSTPGTKDGLYWPISEGDQETSPLGPAVAQAANENYVVTQDGQPRPFHGYYHKILYTPVEVGMRIDPLSKPGRYWLVSTPAHWDESGVMTFASNERGWIYEKNLGRDFDYDDIAGLQIDDTWTRVE
jgi:hypothetical protein